MQEVRLTSASQYDMKEQLQEDGCSVVFGKPQEALSNPWHCKQGGVAIVARNGLVLQRVEPLNDVERELVESRRYVHAAISWGHGRQLLHVISFYGYSGANSCAQRISVNEAMLAQVFEVLALLGSVPVLLAGDFNVKPETSNVIQRSKWIDACKSCASARGVAGPDPTCFVRSTSVGTRIDALIANESARGLLGESGVILDSVLPTHCPVALELRLGDCSREILIL